MTAQDSAVPSGVGVVIVNWNSFDLLSRCLAALMAQEEAIKRIIVVDNASDNAPSELAQPCSENIKYIRLSTNIGFAAANNLAVQQLGDCEWIALVNPDAFPEPAWLKTLMQAANSHPQYSSFASCLVQDKNPAVLDGLGDAYHISGLVWRHGHDVNISEYKVHAREVFSPCAAAALYRRDAFEAVGGFDEDFFCYVEDVDLGFRMRLSGHRCMLVPDAVAHHVGSATTGGRRSNFSVYHGHRNLVWAYIKNMPGVLFWALLSIHIGLNVISIAVFILRGQGIVIIRAKRDALKGIRKMWNKRRSIQHHRKATLRDIWIVLDKRLFKK